MQLNTIKPAEGSVIVKVRAGRGIASGKGKTCGKGHKGQKSRSGGYHKVGFEGGQMPLQRRLPKFGFNSRKSLARAEVRLHQLNKLEGVVDIKALLAANVISSKVEHVKVILAGKIEKAITLKGIAVSKGAKAAIEAAGGKVES